MIQQWETVTDAAEGAFTVQMPHGWQNEARTVRIGTEPRPLLSATRPDNGAFLFVGDANLQTFTEPSALPWGMPPLPNTAPYSSADAFMAWYVQQRYGRMPNFRITGMEPDHESERRSRKMLQRQGVNVRASAAIVSFEFADNRETVRGRFHGGTMSLGMTWTASVSGVMTNSGDDPKPLDALLKHMGDTYQTNPQWRQMQDGFHAQTMAQNADHSRRMMQISQDGHRQNMANIAHTAVVNTQLHNDRMAQSTASHQQFMTSFDTPSTTSGGMSASDINHERFTDYLTDRDTVVDASGDAYKVDTGADRYYVNKSDGTYIGTDRFTEQADLQRNYGVNPDDYEETTFRR